MQTTAVIHEPERRLIDRHFAERGTPDQEVVLRNHLAGCASCREYYDRSALLAALDPKASPAQERLAAGLGFRSGASVRRAGVAGLVLAPALALLSFFALRGLAPLHRPVVDPDASAFVARGGSAAPAPALLAYRVAGGVPRPLAGQMTAGDELAFAYENPTGFAHLLVVGVDGQGRAFWYHPDPDQGQAALPITRAASRQELPVAIRHDLLPGPLRLLGVFSHQALSVGRLAPLLGPAGCKRVSASLPDVACVELGVQVTDPAPRARP